MPRLRLDGGFEHGEAKVSAMPGMGTGLNTNNPTIVSAFHAALLHQGLVVLGIAFVVIVAWNLLRGVQLRRTLVDGSDEIRPESALVHPEPAARRLLRISFGLIWIFDGVLQGQSSMPLGMAPDVLKPAAAASPSWVQHLDNAMATVWSYHPIAAPASAVWIQIGIGVWLLAAPRGNWSRLAGVASAGWGLIVWVFGEAFGQIFAPGLTWLFGAPGAVLFYCLAGVLIAFPESWWATPRLGRLLLRTMGLFFVGMAVLEAWPGRGFWQGQVRSTASPGTLVGMVQQMAQTPQPHLFASWVSAFAGFDAAHAWAVNLFAVVTLGVLGAAFMAARPQVAKFAVAAAVVLCLADWVLIEDLGFMGGVGTDPNSMIPMALILVAGYLALTRPVEISSVVVPIRPVPGETWRQRFVANPTYTFRSVAAIGAIGITLVGAAPMAVAATNPHADPILARAIDGPAQATDYPAEAFSLTDQYGQTVTLADLRGKTIALTLLDPVCTSDCPIIAQEFRAADAMLGSQAPRVEMVAINLNPRFTAVDYLNAFDHQEKLDRTTNWIYLTGSLPELEQAWKAWGVYDQYEQGGAMIDHSDLAYVIDGTGHTRFLLSTDPGPGSEATRSSFSVLLANAVKSVLRS